MKTISIVLFSLLALAGGVSNTQAGTGTVLLAQSAFEMRCELSGGALDGVSGNLACDLGDLVVSCEWTGAYADCGWEGMQNRKVVRLIGQVTPVSLSEGSGGGCVPTWENGLCNPKWGIPD